MKVRTMLGLAAVGGLLYAHRRRGGEWTLESLKDSAYELLGLAKTKAREVRARVRDNARDVAERAEDIVERTADEPLHVGP